MKLIMFTKHSLFLAIIFKISILIKFSIQSSDAPGSILLNHGSFDKVLKKFDSVLVKFDEIYPYGLTHEKFKIVANKSIQQPDFLVAEVNVKDYGDAENHELLKRFDVQKIDFPVYLLFRNVLSQPIKFKGNKKRADEIIAFVLRETGLYLGDGGTIKEFDDLVESYFKSPKINRKLILQEAIDEAKELKHKFYSDHAEVYVKIMTKLQEAGHNQFLISEIKRVNKLLAGKLSSSKKEQLRVRSKILSVFKIRALESGGLTMEGEDNDEHDGDGEKRAKRSLEDL